MFDFSQKAGVARCGDAVDVDRRERTGVRNGMATCGPPHTYRFNNKRGDFFDAWRLAALGSGNASRYTGDLSVRRSADHA